MNQLSPADPSSLFQEDTPPPALPDRYVGIRVLWFKVIIRAVFDWVSYRDSLKFFQRKLAESAATWLFQESNLFTGFDNICVQLDLAPAKVRKWARSMTKDQVTKMEHLERDHTVPQQVLMRSALSALNDTEPNGAE